jgi:hypothetical protein
LASKRSEVESSAGAVASGNEKWFSGGYAVSSVSIPLHFSPRFQHPLIEPDVRISRIRLTDEVHPEAHAVFSRCSDHSPCTPGFPYIILPGS